MKISRMVLFAVCVAVNPVTAQTPGRFAVAVGAALETSDRFGFFPTVRGEWYATDPGKSIGLVADAYVARAFFATSHPSAISTRTYKGIEAGAAASLVLQPHPAWPLSPYLVVGVLGRVSSERDSLWSPFSYGVSFGSDFAIEPNVGIGTRLRVVGNRSVRIELHYYHGLVFFPLTVGLAF